ncbi:MAG: hypothetical protein H0U49_09195 [Parachlamydiaceae bacterium]|nr:hypothetical protein [Parachlamydiaceae bacterium]
MLDNSIPSKRNLDAVSQNTARIPNSKINIGDSRRKISEANKGAEESNKVKDTPAGSKIGNVANKTIPRRPPIPSKALQDEIIASRKNSKEKQDENSSLNKTPFSQALHRAEENITRQSKIETELKTKHESLKNFIHETKLPDGDEKWFHNEIICADMHILMAKIDFFRLKIQLSPEENDLLIQLKKHEEEAKILRPDYINAKIELLKDQIDKLQSQLEAQPNKDSKLITNIRELTSKIDQMQLNYKTHSAVKSQLDIPEKSSNRQVEDLEDKTPPTYTNGLDIANQEIESIATELNIHTSPNIKTLLVPPKLESQAPEDNLLVARIISQYQREKKLISNHQNDKTELSNARKISRANLQLIVENATKIHTYEISSAGSEKMASTTSLQHETNKVESEVASINRLIEANPEFFVANPEFNQHVDTLSKALNKKEEFLNLKLPLSTQGQVSFREDLQQISDAVKIIETAFIQRQEIDALLHSDKINARAAVKAAELKSTELLQIIHTLKEAKAHGTKVVLKGTKESGSIETKRERKHSFKTSKAASHKAEVTFDFILSKIQDVQQYPGLKTQAKEINDLIRNDPSFLKVCKKNSKFETRFKTIDGQLRVKIESINTPISTINELLKPPGNPDFQRAFLNSYRFIINELTGDQSQESSDSQKLFTFMTEKFIAPATTLYEKLQIMKLATQWVNDPYINSYELHGTNDDVSVLKAQIKQLAELAALDGSPTLSELSMILANTSQVAETLSPPIGKIPQGEISIPALIDDIASNNLTESEYKKALIEVAASLTLQNVIIFKSINSAEFKNGKWKDLDENAPIKQFIQGFNSTSNFVVESILGKTIPMGTVLNQSEITQRQLRTSKIIEFFVNLQKELLITQSGGIVDLNGFMAIQAAMNRGEISRLKDVFALLPPEIREANKSFTALADHQMSYKNMRREMDKLTNRQTPFVPFLGMFLTDITFTLEGNEKLKEDEVNAAIPKLIGKSVESLGKMQKNLSIKYTNLVYNLTDILKVGSKYNENIANNTSMAFHPRKKTL